MGRHVLNSGFPRRRESGKYQSAKMISKADNSGENNFMNAIVIRQVGDEEKSPFAARIIFGENHWPEITIANPFDDAHDQDLEWYFEKYLRMPFVDKVRSSDTAKIIASYGENLFGQIFADRNFYAEYKETIKKNPGAWRFEIVGNHQFHALHWETLKDPDLPRPWALQTSMLRKIPGRSKNRAGAHSSSTLNILLISARPGGKYDVKYRTISEPLVRAAENSEVPVKIDIVRPATFRKLSDQLEKKGAGYYHMAHFDAHGGLMTFSEYEDSLKNASPNDPMMYQTVYGRNNIQPYKGQKGFIFLEGLKGADPVEAQQLGDLLINYHIPVVVLNACQSGKQAGVSETNLALSLLRAGVQSAIAMRYSVTVSAAELFMEKLYRRFFDESDFAQSISKARLELFLDKKRRVYFN